MRGNISVEKCRLTEDGWTKTFYASPVDFGGGVPGSQPDLHLRSAFTTGSAARLPGSILKAGRRSVNAEKDDVD